jgi:type I restriction enzyme R subunit
MLVDAGWSVQSLDAYDFSFPGVAIREFSVGRDAADYLLFLDGRAVGVVEAKPEGTTLGGVSVQTLKYTTGLPGFVRVWADPLPFCYESTGVETYFCDFRDPDSRSRHVFSFHRPETLREWMGEKDTLRHRLGGMPPLKVEGLRGCQVEAITNLERSLADNRPRALIQMATGSGKTFTMVTEAYRLIKYAKAKRILFLVDRNNLGKQAKGEFDGYRNPDDGRKLPELYITQRLTSNKLDKPAKIVVSTIQRMFSMLKGAELEEELEEDSMWEVEPEAGEELQVEYNKDYPIETFDFIITDECHRSIYHLWRQVLEYFDAFIIGLTATPSSYTYAFFNQNLVMEYSHERAVADGVNVGYDVYRIKTRITDEGSEVEAGEYVDKRDKQTRRLRWEQLDEPLVYDGSELDHSVVAADQIRTVIRTFRDRLPEIFPDREHVPKTIIFTKDDSHAEDILHIVREEFKKGNEFCQKITYKTTGVSTDTLLQDFRTRYYPRIVVSVDMISTGTDIRPVECLLFMRDIKSRVYFEQMKGRGTRTMDPDALKGVTPDAKYKDHFVIVDAVGVCESDKTDSRPLERKRGITFDQLFFAVASGARDVDSLMSLGNRLSRLDKRLSPEERKVIVDEAGVSLRDMVRGLFEAIDPDRRLEKAREMFGVEEPSEGQLEEAYSALAEDVCRPFRRRKVLDAILEVKRSNEQTIDAVSRDEVLIVGFDPAAREKAQGLVDEFKRMISKRQDELDALQIIYNQPYGSRHLTYQAVRELAAAVEEPPMGLRQLWWAYNVLERDRVRGTRVERLFADVIQLVRFALDEAEVLEPYGDSVDRRFEGWLARQEEAGKVFNGEQLRWLEMIKSQIRSSVEIITDDFENVPFDQLGGLHRAYRLFGNNLNPLLEELNTVLNN